MADETRIATSCIHSAVCVGSMYLMCHIGTRRDKVCHVSACRSFVPTKHPSSPWTGETIDAETLNDMSGQISLTADRDALLAACKGLLIALKDPFVVKQAVNFAGDAVAKAEKTIQAGMESTFANAVDEHLEFPLDSKNPPHIRRYQGDYRQDTYLGGLPANFVHSLDYPAELPPIPEGAKIVNVIDDCITVEFDGNGKGGD